MQMEAGLDTGPVLSQQRVAIEPEHTAQPLEEALAKIGAALLIKTLRGLPAPAQPQPIKGITYADKLTAADRVANWRLGADDVHRQVRALCDRMPVRCKISGALMQILETKINRQSDTGASTPVPGTLCKAAKDGLFVQCGHDQLVITRLKLNRGKGLAMDAAAALNGYPDIFHAGATIDSSSPASTD
tara:strand:- start:54 stop:617 length:564 start_codon:yes stop_codon:yes gene_type:complete